MLLSYLLFTAPFFSCHRTPFVRVRLIVYSPLYLISLLFSTWNFLIKMLTSCDILLPCLATPKDFRKTGCMRKRIIVIVTDEALGEIQKLGEILKSKGMEIDSILQICGVISGSCLEDTISLLRQTPGVQTIEDEGIAFPC